MIEEEEGEGEEEGEEEERMKLLYFTLFAAYRWVIRMQRYKVIMIKSLVLVEV